MTRDEFWRLVEAAGWTEALRTPGVDVINVCGGKLRNLLPTLPDMEVFRSHFNECMADLDTATVRFEAARGVTLPVSDDGYSDLRAMIIGLGKEEFERSCKLPVLIWERAQATGRLTGYVESFAYCIPYEDHYDSLEKKLSRTEQALVYWCDRMVAGDPAVGGEVTRLATEMAKFRSMFPGCETEPEAVIREHTGRATVRARRIELEALIKSRDELDKRIDELRGECATGPGAGNHDRSGNGAILRASEIDGRMD